MGTDTTNDITNINNLKDYTFDEIMNYYNKLNVNTEIRTGDIIKGKLF